jgi:hypothetical protein
MKHLFVIFLLTMIACNHPKESYRFRIDLKGEWQFALDPENRGEEQKWYLSDLNDEIHLPGTTDLNKKGFRNTDTTTLHLNRLYKYEGIAWYRKEISIPEHFREKHIQLVFERTKSTKVWVDHVYVSGSHLLQSPQKFDLSNYLTPGKHYITVQVNNDLKLTPYGNVHIYSDDTQTNWNGIIGKIYLEASPRTYISDLQVFPDVEKQTIVVELEIDNQLNLNDFDIELLVEKTVEGKTIRLDPQKFKAAYQPKIFLEYIFQDNCELWDEYEQPVYHLTAKISRGELNDAQTVPFSMRKFEAKGTQFNINGRTVFLRGKHEAAVFPLTGFPPMEVEDWKKVYKIAKSYGINHYRFHSYCPPEAAFTAADQEGIYLQAELPFWGGLESDTIAERLKEEGIGMLKAYANHPSFVLFSPGNEIGSGHDKIEKIMEALKATDHRPLYTMGSNNNIGYMPPRDYCDFFIGARVPGNGDSIISHVRLTHAYADAEEGGILNTQTPSTDFNFNEAVSQIDIPLISHEIGQYQIYPDFKEIEKYNGVLKAWNLEIFQQRLKKAVMGNMDSIFQQASGAWAARCYKAEMEAALRTQGMGGFQLLDLQDFPGQGTALVGILDAFMDSKEVVTPETWKQSCNDLVILLEFPKYCWTNRENFQAEIIVANYSNETINQALNWEIRKEDGSLVNEGSFSDLKIKNGGLFPVGELRETLSPFNEAERLNVNLSISNTGYSNTYPIWVYPPATAVENTEEIMIAEELSPQVLSTLQSGGKVLFFPPTEDVRGKSFAGHFPPEFWNYGMFKKISQNVHKPISPGTLCILTNPGHPLFNSFPTDFNTNWQWFSMIKASNSLILDNTSDSYLPIVQVVDNLERNHKLGLIFEFKVGPGKLLVCMSQLNRLTDKPEAVQLYRSILNYMNSRDFNPDYLLTTSELKAIL